MGINNKYMYSVIKINWLVIYFVMSIVHDWYNKSPMLMEMWWTSRELYIGILVFILLDYSDYSSIFHIMTNDTFFLCSY